MARPVQEVKVYGVQDRRAFALAKLPWIVRWSINGRQRSKSFRTRSEAERYRSLLLRSVHEGERFDPATGQPQSWLPSETELGLHLWARQWLAEQWPEWAPRTRTSAVEALARLVILAADASRNDVGAFRRDLHSWLLPESPFDGGSSLERWMDQHVVTLEELSRARVSEIERQLGVGVGGQLLSAATAARYRKVAHACILAAVDRELLGADPWPRISKGRTRRKAARLRKAVDVRRLPNAETMERALAAIVSHQPGSKKYSAMTAVVYYGGLRPSEVVMLRRQALHLPNAGWGSIAVTEADISFDEPGEPKTGPRSVPIPPVLVEILRSWTDAEEIDSPVALLFRTRNDNRPTASNWTRAWHRALMVIGHPRLRVYDCRHAAATTWLAAGVPLGEAARRLGHSVETLVSTYVGALTGDEQLSNERIEAVLQRRQSVSATRQRP